LIVAIVPSPFVRHSGTRAERVDPESSREHTGPVWIPGSRFQRAPE
jgi:hypothetical protein